MEPEKNSIEQFWEPYLSRQKGEYERQILFERTSTFILATTFLMIAFATVVVYYYEIQVLHHIQISALLLLAYAMNAVALYLAMYFTVANYHGVLSYSYERGEKDDEEAWGRDQPYVLLPNAIASAPLLLCSAITPTKRPAALHTWLMPYLFCLFWLATWFGALPFNRVATGIVLGVPTVLLGALWIISWKKPRYTYTGKWDGWSVELKRRHYVSDEELAAATPLLTKLEDFKTTDPEFKSLEEKKLDVFAGCKQYPGDYVVRYAGRRAAWTFDP
jgi:hypothetical protein